MATSPASSAVTLDQLIALSDEMRALVRCGVPLERGLAALAEDLPQRSSTIVSELARSGQTGQTVDQWLDRHANRLPPVYRAMIQAGLRSGRLGAALEGFVATARRATQLRRITSLALLYPLLVLMLASVLAGVIVGRLAEQYQELERLRSIPEDSIIGGAIPVLQFVGRCAWIVAPAALIPVLAWWWRSRLAPVLQPARFGRWMGWVPGARQMLRSSFTATFTDLLALLIEQRVPLDTALPLAAQASGDRITQREADQLARELAQGGKVSPAADRRSAISPLVRWLLSSRCDSAQLVAALRSHARSEERRAEYLSERMRIQLPVILTVGIGGTATFGYAMSVLGPWYGLMHDLTQAY